MRLLKNIFSLFVLQGANYLIPMITLPYLVRVLEPEAYGQMSFVAALVMNFVIFVEYGFYVSGTGQIAKLRGAGKTPGEAAAHGQAKACARVIQDVYAAKLMLFLASSGVAVVLTLALPKVGAHWDLVAIGFLSVTGQWLLPQWVLLGLEQMRLLTWVTVLPRVLMVPALLVFVQRPEDVGVAWGIQAGTALVSGVVGVYFVREHFVGFQFRWREAMVQLQSGFAAFSVHIGANLYTASGALFLGFFVSTVAAGQYTGAWKILIAVHGLMWPITQAVYPHMSALSDRDSGLFALRLKWLALIMGAVSLGLALGTAVLAGFVSKLLLGEGFEEAGLILVAMSPFLVLSALSQVFGFQGLVPLGRSKSMAKVYAIGTAVGLVLVWPMMSWLGAVGPAVSMVAAEAVVVAGLFWVLRGALAAARGGG